MTAYRCARCGAEGCKLWRQYQTFLESIELLCVDCAQRDQGRTLDLTQSDAIGWLVPAVPCGDSFWGYTSVPADDVRWWKSLPLTASSAPSAAARPGEPSGH